MSFCLALAREYDNLVFYNRLFTFRLVLWALWAGIIIAMAASYYTKDYLGRLVRRLLKNEALSPDKAMTFAELGYEKTFPLRLHVRDGALLRRFIEVANEDEATEEKLLDGKEIKIRRLFGLNEKPKKYDYAAMKFFIPEEKKYAADVQYEKKGSDPRFFLISAILMTGLALLVSFLVPELLTMLDNFINIVRNAF